MPNLVRLTSGTLIGRVEELQAALAALRDLLEGRPGVVVVRGPAGIGKTRFVMTLADRLRVDGVRVMVGASSIWGWARRRTPPSSGPFAASTRPRCRCWTR